MRITRPYLIEWESTPSPKKYKSLKLVSCDGKGSPNQHMYCFLSQIGYLMGNYPVMIKKFYKYSMRAYIHLVYIVAPTDYQSMVWHGDGVLKSFLWGWYWNISPLSSGNQAERRVNSQKLRWAFSINVGVMLASQNASGDMQAQLSVQDTHQNGSNRV